jgi:hypothetical protein
VSVVIALAEDTGVVKGGRDLVRARQVDAHAPDVERALTERPPLGTVGGELGP